MATHYVNSTTSSTNWAASTNIDTPCTPATAFSNATGNDLVYFREGSGGTYTRSGADWVTPYYYPANSGNSWADPLIFKAYLGETVTLTAVTGPVIGIYENGVDYVTFDGFDLYGCTNNELGPITLNGGNGSIQRGITLKNCTIRGTQQDNGDLAPLLFMRGIYGYLIQNNVFRDKVLAGGDTTNITCITMYSCQASISPAIEAVIEKNTFYNNHNGIKYKLNSSGGAVCSDLKCRYNLFYDNTGFDIEIDYNSEDGEFYQNLFIDGVITSADSGYTSPRHKIYNNTFIGGEDWLGTRNNLVVEGTHLLTDWEWYNNICYAKVAAPDYIYTNASGSDPDYADYNLYYATGTKEWYLASTAHTLAQWQATPHFYDTHCVTTQPTFENYTGDETGDYRLAVGSAGINAGRYGENMGCYITGSEQIGYLAGGNGGSGGTESTKKVWS
jgi:hypothetical protein